MGHSTEALETNLIGPFREGLREHGYVEGRNIEIVFRWAEGKYELFPVLITELIAAKVDMIVTAGTPASLAVKDANTSIPLIMIAVGEPVVLGFVASLARPGGNITGITSISTEIEGKRLELLRELVPNISYIAVLWNAGSPVQVIQEKETRAAADVIGMKMLSLGVRSLEEIEKAFTTIIQGAAGRTMRAGGSAVPAPSQTHHGLRHPAPLAGSACVPGIGRGGRTNVLRTKLRGNA